MSDNIEIQDRKDHVESNFIGKWRKAVSLSLDARGKLRAYRYFKEEGGWRQILFFTEAKDMADCVRWMIDCMAQNTPEVIPDLLEGIDDVVAEHLPHLMDEPN